MLSTCAPFTPINFPLCLLLEDSSGSSNNTLTRGVLYCISYKIKERVWDMTPLGTCEAVLRLTGLDFLNVDQTSNRERAMFPLPWGQTSYFLSNPVKMFEGLVENVNCGIPPHFWGWSCCKFIYGIKTMQDIWMIMISFFIVKKRTYTCVALSTWHRSLTF